MRRCWAFFLPWLALAAPAQAALIVFDFTAEVIASDGTVAALGDTVSGQFAFGDDLAACGQTGTEPVLVTFCEAGPGYTIGADWFLSVVLGAQTASLTTAQADFELEVSLGRLVDPGDPSQGHGSDELRLFGIGGVFLIDLLDDGATALPYPDGTFPGIPTSLDLLAWPDRATLAVSGLGLGSFTAQLTTLSLSVPEPASALLLGLAAFGLCVMRRRR